MEITLPWHLCRTVGPQGLLEALQALFPSFDLYKVTVDWVANPRYGAKAKGTGGDVLVYWTENALLHAK